MESKHTPGPWFLDDKCGSLSTRFGHVYDSFSRMIADAYGENQTQVSANSRLIAAAPDLLSACEAALRFVQTPAPEYAKSMESILSAAIARAKGE